MHDIKQLHDAELKLSLQFQALQAKLIATSGEDALDSFLASGTVESNASELAETRSQLDAIEAAIASARERRQDAIRAHYANEAATLLEQAAQLRTEATERQQRTDELLQQLRDWEDTDYVPLTQAESFHYSAVTTKTATLLAQAEQLERRANASKPIRDFGQLQAASMADVLRRIEGLSPLELGPAMPDVARWLSEHSAKVGDIEAKARRSSDGWGIVGGNIVIALVWEAGDLDIARSRYDWQPVYSDRDVHAVYAAQADTLRKATPAVQPIEA